jgi:hypothetical protein
VDEDLELAPAGKRTYVVRYSSGAKLEVWATSTEDALARARAIIPEGELWGRIATVKPLEPPRAARAKRPLTPSGHSLPG